jgi:hypothetical protein
VGAPGRPAPSVAASRRVPKVELGVRLPDGRQTTGHPIEDYIQLLLEAVEHALANEIIDEELKATERRLVELPVALRLVHFRACGCKTAIVRRARSC